MFLMDFWVASFVRVRRREGVLCWGLLFVDFFFIVELVRLVGFFFFFSRRCFMGYFFKILNIVDLKNKNKIIFFKIKI